MQDLSTLTFCPLFAVSRVLRSIGRYLGLIDSEYLLSCPEQAISVFLLKMEKQDSGTVTAQLLESSVNSSPTDQAKHGR